MHIYTDTESCRPLLQQTYPDKHIFTQTQKSQTPIFELTYRHIHTWTHTETRMMLMTVWIDSDEIRTNIDCYGL